MKAKCSLYLKQILTDPFTDVNLPVRVCKTHLKGKTYMYMYCMCALFTLSWMCSCWFMHCWPIYYKSFSTYCAALCSHYQHLFLYVQHSTKLHKGKPKCIKLFVILSKEKIRFCSSVFLPFFYQRITSLILLLPLNPYLPGEEMQWQRFVLE